MNIVSTKVIKRFKFTKDLQFGSLDCTYLLMYPRVPYSKYCMRGEVERIIKHEVKLSVLLLLDTTTQVQYECKARAKGTLTGLLCNLCYSRT